MRSSASSDKTQSAPTSPTASSSRLRLRPEDGHRLVGAAVVEGDHDVGEALDAGEPPRQQLRRVADGQEDGEPGQR
jgi:hypothetical protein